MPRNAPAPGPGIPHDPPVVLVVFDALPVRLLEDATGHIDSERFPNFAALARTGTWYRNATTIHESTRFSVPAILDGERPRPGVAETLQRRADTGLRAERDDRRHGAVVSPARGLADQLLGDAPGGRVRPGPQQPRGVRAHGLGRSALVKIRPALDERSIRGSLISVSGHKEGKHPCQGGHDERWTDERLGTPVLRRN
jgi:hypothetical protein